MVYLNHLKLAHIYTGTYFRKLFTLFVLFFLSKKWVAITQPTLVSQQFFDPTMKSWGELPVLDGRGKFASWPGKKRAVGEKREDDKEQP